MKLFIWTLSFICVKISTIQVDGLLKCATNFSKNHEKQMNNKKDTIVSPCTDFYSHACGGWNTPYYLRALGARDTLTAVKAENKFLLLRFFQSIADGDDSLLEFLITDGRKRLVNFYRSCENLPTTEEKNASIKFYMDELRYHSGWPILNSNFWETSSNASFDWEHVSAHMRRFGANSFWRTLVQPNWQASEQLIFYIVPPSFDFLQSTKRTQLKEEESDLNQNRNNESDEVFLYKTYIKYMLLDMGLRIRKALKNADEIVRFEQAIMALTTSTENSVVLKAPQTLQSLANEFPDIKLEKYFDTLLQDIDMPADYKKNLLIAADKKYLQKLSKLLKNANTEIIEKYLFIQFLSHFELNLHVDSLKERQEYCLEQANTFLSNELSKLFLDLKHENNGLEFFHKAQQDLNTMFENLKQHFETLINATSVFNHDDTTRIEGLKKLHAMQLKLPDLEIETKELVDKFESDLVLNENYDLNLMQLYKLQSFREFIAINNSLNYDAELLNSVSEFERVKAINSQSMTNYGPLNVNAYYRLKKNAIEIPVGLLALPIYDNCLEVPLIYGTIGYIVGHELLHGFDYDGLNYDKSGNIADGWDPKSIIAFGTKASCYLGSRYNDAHINVNENIADSEGLRLALGALQKSMGTVQPAAFKLFFTSFAQIWCRISDENNEHHALHATHHERVNNVLGNFPEFTETFKCRENSEMNPAEKCRIW